MLLLFVTVASGIALTTAFERPYYKIEEPDTLFEEFIKTYGKKYSDVEKQERLLIFIENVKIINEKNSDNDAVFAINQFTDLNEEEFKRKHTGFNPRGHDSNSSKGRHCKMVYAEDITTADAPDLWDWRSEGAVTAVKNQLGCGGCWAFSTIGTIEGQYFLKIKNLINFSEQSLVDCSKNNNHCDGGFMTDALLDLIDIGGLQTEVSYPFADGLQECKFNRSKAIAKVKGCTKYLMSDEVKFKEVLFKTGPLAIGINGLALKAYKAGILRKHRCKAESLNHAVLLVGYGTEYGVDYWIFKNSWGTIWGEEGFFRIHRGDNTCGFMNEISNCSPVLE